MNEERLRRKLDRAEKKVAVLEQMIEDKTRALFLSSEKLRATIQYLEAVQCRMPGALVIADAEGNLRSVNRSAEALLGATVDELVGQPLEKIWAGGSQVLARAGAEAGLAGEEVAWQNADGVDVPVLISVSALDISGDGANEYICIGTDLRVRKSLEVELRHAHKLESVGQLAAGVAHEINTPMQFIGDNVHFLRDAFSDLLGLTQALESALEQVEDGVPAALQESLEEAFEEADVDFLRGRVPKAFERTLDGVTRVSTIVAAMKAFSHPQTDKAPLDLNQAIETTLTVAKSEYKYVANVELELGELPLVVCQGGDINQVILNLLVNAAHAIEDGRGDSEELGTIRVASRLDGDAVLLSIGDSGCGIPEDVRDRIFDPFFTTKDVGRGTGQGLSLAHQIVHERHGGKLSFETEIGKGTTFFIRLPIQPARPREAAA
ncbi:MAG: ATP-binding protein [Myxococcota bacterium]